MRALAAGLIAVALATTAQAQGVNPDELRERTRPSVQAEQVQTRGKADREDHPQAALSEAFKKYSSMWLLAWRQPNASFFYAGQFSSARHCAAAQKTLQAQLRRHAWGKSECIELVQP